jgi:pimeloyl-ACP methyl ester carboxylesterase
MWLWIKRLVISFAGLLLLGAVVGTAYQWISTRRDLARHPGPGILIDVGGHRLHVWCTGTGSPTVVLESGLGGSSADWGFVQPAVAQFTRVCSYDRAGLGYSDAGPSPRTAERMARELGILLDRSGVAGRVILVGASLGAFAVRVFASAHQARVAGLVLVDASHEDQQMDVPAIAPFVPLLASTGVLRALGVSFSSDPEWLAPAVRDFARATRFRTTVYSAAANEVRQARESAAQVRSTRRQLSMPLVVLTGGRGNDGRWKELQADQLRLSTSACQLIAEQSGHTVPIAQPDAVTRAIRVVVEAVRGRTNGPPCRSFSH